MEERGKRREDGRGEMGRCEEGRGRLMWEVGGEGKRSMDGGGGQEGVRGKGGWEG